MTDFVTGEGILNIGRQLTGEAAEESIERATAQQVALGREALEEQRASKEEALQFFTPFQGVAEQAVDASSFLTDPQAQFDFLQSNPLFQAALENANQQTQASAAARGRLSAGDTLSALAQNTLLAAQPLIGQQTANISNLLNLGFGTAQSQANTALGVGSNISNLLTGIGATQAAGTIGAQNARSQGLQNILNLGGQAAGFLSDPRLKEDIKFDSVQNGINVYRWKWNDKAKELFGLDGESFGVMADEVKKVRPEAVINYNGVDVVNYEMIEVQHGS